MSGWGGGGGGWSTSPHLQAQGQGAEPATPSPSWAQLPEVRGGSKSRSGNKIQLNTGVLSCTASGLTGRLVKILLPLLTLIGYCETFAKRNLQVCVLDMHLTDLNLQLLWLQGYADDPCSGAAASPNSLGLQTNPCMAVNGHKHKCVGNEQVISKSEQIYGNNKVIISPSVVHKQTGQQ